MPIDFRCTKCNKLLRTPDDTAGKQARCPECGTLLPIPTPVPASGQPSPARMPVDLPGYAAGVGVNPYQAPATASAAQNLGAAAPGAIVPSRIELGEVLGRSWRVFKNQMGLCIGVGIAAFVIMMVFNGVVQFAIGRLMGINANGSLTGPGIGVQQILTGIFQAWITAGVIDFSLHVARGSGAEFTQLFGGGRWFLPILIAKILYGMIVLVGFVLLIIPGIIAALMFSQYSYLIVDKNLGIIESLQVSREITRGNKTTLMGLGIVTGLIALLAALPLLLGLIVVGPWFVILFAVAYLLMSGQAVADPGRPNAG